MSISATGRLLIRLWQAAPPSCLPFPTQFYLFAEMANLKQLIRKSRALQNHVAASKLPNPRIG